MKRLLATTLLSLACFAANAEWIRVESNADETRYVDSSSIEGKGNIRKITELRNFQQTQVSKSGYRYLSKYHVLEFKCSEKTMKVLLTVAYESINGKGKGVFKDDVPTPTYESFNLQSSTAASLKIACNR